MNRRLDALDPLTYQKAVRLFACFTLATGRELFIVRTLATAEEQDALYAQGRTEPGPVVTYARGGDSWHITARAFDVALEELQTQRPSWSTAGDDLELWRLLGTLAKAIGLEWGGDFRRLVDFGHFHDARGESLDKARASYARQPKEA